MYAGLSCEDSDGSVTLPTPDIQEGQTLLGGSCRYSVLEFIGEGCFGKVARCVNLNTSESVAVKILKKDSAQDSEDIENEVSILKALSVLNPDVCNLVRFFEQFDHMGYACLSFEMLDRNLHDLLADQDYEPMSLNEIRPVAKQLLVALDALKGLGILHTDIKLDNVMLVDAEKQPFRVKLIDFGLAIPATTVQPGMLKQPLGFRAPEVSLGLRFTEAVDMWGLGCVLASLYLAHNLFSVRCEYQMMRCLVEILGQPGDHVLSAGQYTHYFFKEEGAAGGTRWRLMTAGEYSTANNTRAGKRHALSEVLTSLDDLIDLYPKGGAAENKDRRIFVDLLKQMLHLDGDLRISPCEALQHPFITMSHLSDYRRYLTSSHMLMRPCPVQDSDSSAATEPDPKSDPSEGPSDDPPDSRSFSGDDDPDWSADEAEAADLKDSEKPLKRIQRLFGGIRASVCCCCCWSPAEEA